ncbi:MAG: ABC transporter permease [Steroidobacteraceae bacterium]
MKFLPLVWAGLWRKPIRSVLTAICIATAFVLLGLLQGVNAGFERGIASAHRELLRTGTRVRGGAPMPIAAMETIRRIPGVKEVAPRAYFMGTYRGTRLADTVAAIATQPDAFFRWTRFGVARAALEAMRETRDGMLVTPPELERFGWKVGDRITLRSSTRKTDGTSDWTFDILGTFDTPTPASFGVINYDYFNSYRAADRDTAEIFYVRIADPNRSIATSAAIDRIFANSSHETRTSDGQTRAEASAKQLGDVEFFTDAIMGAVLFTLAFLTGNTLRESFRQRRREFAVLETIGYPTARILGLAYAEALLLYLPPAAFGLLIARLLTPLIKPVVGVFLVSPSVAALGLLCAALLAFLAVVLSIRSLTRVQVATALAHG